MAPKPDRPAIIFGMVAKLFAKATTKFGLATTNLPTAIEQRCRCSLDRRSRVARFSRLTRWSPEMKTLLLIADAGSDSGPALGSRAGAHHQRAVVTARVPGPNRNKAMTCGSG